MADDPLKALADAFKNAAPGPVALNAAFIATGGVTAPTDFDTQLKAAFRLTGDGLNITYEKSNVGTPSDSHFQITAAQLSDGFLNAPAANTDVTLSFTLAGGTLSVQIEANLGSWSFTDFFPFMTGWPFDQVNITIPTFIFSTEKM
ncbi:MAG: hypothetical protein ACTSV1_06810, partial [Alphaproteobacteria bacterium]